MPLTEREPIDDAVLAVARSGSPPAPPHAGVVRDAHIRRARRRRRAVAAALLALATAGAAAAALAGSSSSRSTTHPALAQASAFQSAEDRCRSLLPSAAELAPEAPRSRAPRSPALSERFWRTVLVDTRGPTTAIVFAPAAGRGSFQCFVGRMPKSGSLSGGYGTRPPVPVPSASVSTDGSGGYRTQPAEGSQLFSWIVGRAGTRVREVRIRFAGGGHIAVRPTHGWFLAWWRGRRPLARSRSAVAAVV